jgi:hypothetical protein
VRTHGYAVTTEQGKTVEEDTLQCGHCQRVIFIKPGTPVDAGFCRRCMRHLCGPCTSTGRCEPFEKKIEAQEARNRFLETVCG